MSATSTYLDTPTPSQSFRQETSAGALYTYTLIPNLPTHLPTMATATQTATDAHVLNGPHSATEGALIHQDQSHHDMVHQTRGSELVSSTHPHQPRPQSGAFSIAEIEEERPGAKKSAQFLPWYTRWGYSISLGAAQGFLRPASLIRDTQDAIRSPVHQPNMIRSYECRKLLPVRYVSLHS